MKKQAVLFLALALAFALAPSLEAQEKLTWNGRTLVGTRNNGTPIEIDNIVFEKLYGDGDPNVAELKRGIIGTGKKTTVDMIEKDKNYTIRLSRDQYLEVSGTSSKSGFEAPVFYVIKGPTTLSLYWHKDSIINFPEHPNKMAGTMVYEDKATYNRIIAEQYVDQYVIPIMNYSATTKLYNDTKKTFEDYIHGSDKEGRVNIEVEKRSKQCPESIGCVCQGDIVEHIIFSTAFRKGLIAGAIAAIPYSGGTLIDVLSESEKRKIKTTAVLATAIGYHYGWYPNREEFNDRFRNDAIVIFSGATAPESGALTIASAASQEFLQKCQDELVDQLAPNWWKTLTGLPGLGNVISFAFGGMSEANYYRRAGDNAVRFFKVIEPINWIPVQDVAFSSGGTIRGVAYGSVGSFGWGGRYDYFPWWVAVGDRDKMAYSADGISWTRVADVTFLRATLRNGATMTSSIRDIAYGNGRFVAGDNFGRTSYSADGASWTVVANAGFGTFGINAIAINAVAYGNGRFVAGGEYGRIAYADW